MAVLLGSVKTDINSNYWKKGDNVSGYFLEDGFGVQLVNPKTKGSFLMDGEIIAIKGKEDKKYIEVKWEQGLFYRKYYIPVAKKYLKKSKNR